MGRPPPSVSPTPCWEAAFAGQSYADVAAAVFAKFAGDEIASADLTRMCREAYATFSHKAVVPMVQVGPQTFIAELFHGPSLAFKDVAMQILARLYDHLLHLTRPDGTIPLIGDDDGGRVECWHAGGGAAVGRAVHDG